MYKIKLNWKTIKNIKKNYKKYKQDNPKSTVYKFTTFQGVFVPSVLAILGAVMFLILPKVLGGVGLLKMFGIIILAHSVTIATAFSLSAIATNIQVKGGGLYYLISRSLGSEFGGALGIQLYLAQTVATAFYSIAFARGISSMLSYINVSVPEVYIALVACMFFGMVAYGGARFVIKVQYLIFGAILISLVSIFFGPAANTGDVVFTASSLSFWVAFALFFPAVTGIDAGVGMSGDLKDPRKSLVRGTFIAIILTMAVYIAMSVRLAFAAPLSQLFADPFIINKISLFPSLVILGIILATSSSALSYFMSAPRTLRALAEDNIFTSKTRFLAGSIGESREPRIALLLSLTIAIVVIFSGGLDLVSQMVTVFFLNIYGWINASAFFEKFSRNPSYRPSFNSPLIISFYGMIICYLIMFLYNPLIMIISILFQVFVFHLLMRSKKSIKLESVWDGVLFQFLRKIVSYIERTAKSKKNWRPTIVSFCANSVNTTIIFSLLDWIGATRGITKFYYLFSGKIDKGIKKRDIVEEEMRQYIKENNLEVYPRVIETKNYMESVETVLQSETIGNLPLNTALLDFDSEFKMDKLVKLTAKLKKNVIILRNVSGFSDFKFVDVWWDKPDDGNLMILIAYLVTHSKTWMEKGASIRLFKVVNNEKDSEFFRNKLNKLIKDSRIDNITVNIINEKKKNMPQIIKENSHYANLVLLGIPHIRKGIYPNIHKEIDKYTKDLSASLVVLANDEIDFRIN